MQALTNNFSKNLLIAFTLILVMVAIPAGKAWAADPCRNPDATARELRGKKCCDKTSSTSTTLRNCVKENPIIKDINMIVNFLSAGAGIVIVGSIIVGGIQYTLAGNNPNNVSAAKKRITDALIALLAFFFIFSFLQWLIPGGLLFS